MDYYPFEITENTFVSKSVGNIKKGNVKSASISARVRRDALQGYYSIPILIEWDGGNRYRLCECLDFHQLQHRGGRRGG